MPFHFPIFSCRSHTSVIFKRSNGSHNNPQPCRRSIYVRGGSVVLVDCDQPNKRPTVGQKFYDQNDERPVVWLSDYGTIYEQPVVKLSDCSIFDEHPVAGQNVFDQIG